MQRWVYRCPSTAWISLLTSRLSTNQFGTSSYLMQPYCSNLARNLDVISE